MKEESGNGEIKVFTCEDLPGDGYIQGEEMESPLTINDLIAQMVTQEVAVKTVAALELIQASMDDVGDKMDQGLLKFKEQASDIIGAQISAIKVDEVAKAVKDAVAEAKLSANMKTMEQLSSQFNFGETYSSIQDLISSMGNTRHTINSKRQTLRTVRQFLSDTELTVKEAESSLLADITGETLPGSDKPRFSNDKARQAELMARKKTDPDYLAATNQYRAVRDQVESLEDEIYSLEVELKTAELQFQAECRAMDSMTAEMNIYAAALGAGGKLPAMSTGPATTVVQNHSCQCNHGQEPKAISQNNDKGAW